MSLLLASCLLVVPSLSVPVQAPLKAALDTGDAEGLVGTWDGTYEPPAIVGGDPCSLRIRSVDGGAFRGDLVLPVGVVPIEGRFERETASLRFEARPGNDVVRGELLLVDGELRGHGTDGSFEYGFLFAHVDEAVLERSHRPRVVEWGEKERPEVFSMVGLEAEVGFELDELMRKVAERNQVVGMSVACVVDGELVDVRSLGWEDFFADVPATSETRYRWASISKPLTATTALRLARQGRLDLDRDVRTWVPEFPDKGATITPRLILGHLSGIVHYNGALRTWRDYESEHPFEELANGLDLFRESALLAPPGAAFSYSTHAWTLLGVALERVGERPFHELVREQVLAPLGMKTTEPDFVSRRIPHRTQGYELEGDVLYETLGDDVAWKLPGGGWTSTVGDLALFGAGLLGSELLDEADKAAAWTVQHRTDGSATNMGLGFGLGELEGERLVSHSGGQRKTSTFLAMLPERGLAVAVMCNTMSTPMGEVALGALRLLLRAE